MKRAVASLATALAAFSALSALGQTLAYVMDSPFASVALGQTLAMPQVQETYYYGVTATSDTVPLRVIGNCGNFGGATMVSVTVKSAGPGPGAVLLGTPPPFTATAVGECRLRIERFNYYGEVIVDVYDPKTLRVEAKDVYFPLMSVAKKDSSQNVAARVVDAGGFHAIGRSVRYDPDPHHCALLNGVDAPYVAVSDATGVAPLPFSVPANAPDGTCTVTATLVETGQQAPIQAFVYDAALATLTPTPATISTYTNDYASVGVVIRDVHGNLLPGVAVDGRDVTYIGGPGFASNTSFGGSTNTVGEFGMGLIATNGLAGRYEIGLYTMGRQFRVPVVQSTRGQPAPAPLPPITQSVQDLWWGGTAQNGWGVSIIEHRDTLFGVIYAYDDVTDSNRWFAIPGGTWDDTHTRYTGLIYMPHGTPFQSYDASRFAAEDPLGTATLMFVDAGNMTLDIEMQHNTVNSKIGRVLLSRQSFGSGTSSLSHLSDMWWGGEQQNGWGVSVLQQFGALFSVWYTYGSDGLPTWYFMPTGTWTEQDTYEGRMYVTKNYSDWIGGYIPDRLQVTDVGPFKFRFKTDSTATLDYTVGSDHGTLSLVREPF